MSPNRHQQPTITTSSKCYLFAFRMSYSGKAVHLVSATCGQEAFLEGHVHAFTVLGGVPAGQIRYDNLTPAVTRVLRKGRARIENPRWTAFRSHYEPVPVGSLDLLPFELVLAAG